MHKNANYSREKMCAHCGSEFTAKAPNTKYCSEKCKKEATALLDAKYKQKYKEKQEEQRKRKTAIIDISVEAKKHGMSYGKYVAMMKL